MLFKLNFFVCVILCASVAKNIQSILLILSDNVEWMLSYGFIIRQDLQDLVDLFFACGDAPFGRRPLHPDNPVDPV